MGTTISSIVFWKYKGDKVMELFLNPAEREGFVNMGDGENQALNPKINTGAATNVVPLTDGKEGNRVENTVVQMTSTPNDGYTNVKVTI
jgi:hypothetical protein